MDILLEMGESETSSNGLPDPFFLSINSTLNKTQINYEH